ncbi:MAG: helix-turn-helix transcriptional regulator [Lachnospiraceae bacterium]|nr:helix-turn-helix transcriptional regulator [Lachnospiraceae bacterium]
MPENYIIIHLQELLDERGMSRYQLSQQSGVPQSSISTIINKGSMPTFETLNKLCNGLHITLAEFFAPGERLDLTESQKILLNKWDKMDSHDQEIAMAYIDGVMSKK